MKNKQMLKTPGKRLTKSLGPVSDLERHVNPEWWRYTFNALYLKTDGDVAEDNAITTHEVDRFLQILNIKKDASILEVCCGQGRHCFELFKRGYKNVEGIDRSTYHIAKARNRARLQQCSIPFKEGDARKL